MEREKKRRTGWMDDGSERRLRGLVGKQSIRQEAATKSRDL